MRKKIALLSLASLLAISLMAVSSAQAATQPVSVKPASTDLCLAAPNALSYRFKFTGSVAANRRAKLKEIRIKFRVSDTPSKRVIKSGVVKLKRAKGYKAQTSRFTVYADQQVSYYFEMSYKYRGKTFKSKHYDGERIPSQESFSNSGWPAC